MANQANQYINIGGLWEKDTARGKVLSCKLTDVTIQKFRKALDDAAMGSSLVIFQNDRRDSDVSPTHRLVVSVPVEPARDAPVPTRDRGDEPLPF